MKSATADFAERVKEQASLAGQVASKIHKDPKVAGPLAWLVLEDVNAHQESSIAEGVLSSLDPDGAGATEAQSHVSGIGRHLAYGVVEAGAFGVALMMAVGQPGPAKTLAKAMISAFKEYLGPGQMFD